jgi:uncharacterized protein YhdP
MALAQETERKSESPPDGAAAPARTLILNSRWLRTSIIVGLVVASFASALAIAYELAVARVPRHRAALESLVRAQTGLDIRFNELSLRWGWYGPEAVFRRVELGEPGRSNVLLRAPQLVVAINAWQSARAGRLVSGRITLIAPDIDLERLARTPPSEPGARTAPSGKAEARARRAQVLERWKGGVIDLQGGTLRLPDPAGSESALTLQIRRAAVRRVGDEWSGHALVFLPERMGRTARVVMQLSGDISSPASLSGKFRFEGVRLAFSSWRGMLGELPKVASNLPESGSGDVTVDLTLNKGRVEKADGELRAVDLVVGSPPWLQPVQQSRGSLKLDYLTGKWRLLRRGATTQFQVEQLVLSREQKSPLPHFTVELNGGHLHGSLETAPLSSVSVIARWLAPELVIGSVALEGTVGDIDVDWNPARPDGFRLAASAKVEEATADSVVHGFTLKRLPVRIHATEERLALEVDAPEAWLRFAADPEQPLESVELASRVAITRSGEGWQMQIPQLTFRDKTIEGEISGTISAAGLEVPPLFDMRGTVAHADVAKLQTWFAGAVAKVLGSNGMRIGAGRIENGTFELRGTEESLFGANSPIVPRRSGSGAARAPTRLSGGFTLRDVRLPPDGAWPETEAPSAKVEWSGSRVRATADEARAGAFEVESIVAEWDVSGRRASHVFGRAHGPIEAALAWVRDNPDAREYAPHLQDIVARGDAVYDFDVTAPPPATPGEAVKPRARISASLEGVQFTLAPELPPIESLRGVIAYDAGRLQRSTLTATWLGGPLTLRLAERRDRSSLAVQAQGFVDAQKLVALSEVRHLAEVRGETSWAGDFSYTPPTDTAPARWQGRADSNLIGVVSELPAPLAKTSATSLPLHVEIAGVGDESELRATLADRLRAALALRVVDREDWVIERGAVRFGTGAVTLPTEDVVQVRGRVRRLEAPASVLAWQQLRKGSPSSQSDIDISADELVFGERVYEDARVQSTAAAGKSGDAIRIEAPSLGVLTATLLPDARELVFAGLRLKKDSLAGSGNVRCAADLATCHSEFELESTDVAATLVDFGFRPDLSAEKGSLSGEVSWRPLREGSWLEDVSGTLSMRFEDGVARDLSTTDAAAFPLLTVPALLGGISRHPSAVSAATNAAASSAPGELRFTQLDGHFQLRGGQATTSDLHFDGEAEILVRGRIGLVTHDYDHEAWVLRGEDRIPASMRRLASTPRMAAAWLTLRELMGGEPASQSRIVLRMKGSWSEPIVSVE